MSHLHRLVLATQELDGITGRRTKVERADAGCPIATLLRGSAAVSVTAKLTG